jgi:hypothetical protein
MQTSSGLYLKHMGAQGIQHVLRFAADCRGSVLINLSYMIINSLPGFKVDYTNLG